MYMYSNIEIKIVKKDYKHPLNGPILYTLY